MNKTFRIGWIEIEVMVITSYSWTDPPQDELVTVFRSVVEGKDIEWRTSQVIPEYLSYPEMEKLFNNECEKYAFISRNTNKESE